MKKIDLEAHFFTEDYLKAFGARKEYPMLEPAEDENHEKYNIIWHDANIPQMSGAGVGEKLLEVGEGRIKAMEAGGIDMQAISLSDPGLEVLDAETATIIARKTNDQISKVIRKYPDKFIGLATIAVHNPEEAARELERSVKELGFCGGKVNSNLKGEYLDDRKYWPIWEKVEKLDVPIYLHPMVTSSTMMKAYTTYGGFLAGPSLGYAADASLHAMHLIASGLFDKYPGLTIILGHLGEGLPFWMERLNQGWQSKQNPVEVRPKCQKKPSEYVKSNFIMTTSGMHQVPAFICTYLAMGADKMAFAADYPFTNLKQDGELMEAMPICDADKEKICHGTAERIFKLA